MSEKRRSAAEIIRYCEARDAIQSYLQFDLYAHVDLPAVVNAAVELRWALQVAASALRARGMPSNASTMQRTLNDTAWLEDGDD